MKTYIFSYSEFNEADATMRMLSDNDPTTSRAGTTFIISGPNVHARLRCSQEPGKKYDVVIIVKKETGPESDAYLAEVSNGKLKING